MAEPSKITAPWADSPEGPSDFSPEDARRWEAERKQNLLMKPRFFPETTASATPNYAAFGLPWEYNYSKDSWEWGWPKMLVEAAQATKGAAEMAGGQRPVDEKGVTKFLLDAWMPGGFAGSLAAPAGGLGVIKGFHGTPYRFDPVDHNPFGEFKNEAIGSGEGAAAYGFGHYVAGKEGVAKYYKESLADKQAEEPLIILGGKPFFPSQHDDMDVALADRLWEAFQQNKSIRAVRDELEFMSKQPDDYRGYNKLLNEKLKAWEDQGIESIKPGENWEPPKVPEGSLYSVEIGLEPEHLLDWDSAVPAEIKNKVLALAKEQHPSYASDFERLEKLYGGPQYDASSGNRFYKDLSDFLPVAKTSALLAKAGIPGIKYLDQGSRDRSLTVLFDEKLLAPDDIPSAVNDIQRLALEELLETQGNVGAAANRLAKDYTHAAKERRDPLLKEAADWLIENQTRFSVRDDRSRNYVIFDPKHLKITARNGVPLERVDHDPFKETSK